MESQTVRVKLFGNGSQVIRKVWAEHIGLMIAKQTEGAALRTVEIVENPSSPVTYSAWLEFLVSTENDEPTIEKLVQGWRLGWDSCLDQIQGKSLMY